MFGLIGKTSIARTWNTVEKHKSLYEDEEMEEDSDWQAFNKQDWGPRLAVTQVEINSPNNLKLAGNENVQCLEDYLLPIFKWNARKIVPSLT